MTKSLLMKTTLLTCGIILAGTTLVKAISDNEGEDEGSPIHRKRTITQDECASNKRRRISVQSLCNSNPQTSEIVMEGASSSFTCTMPSTTDNSVQAQSASCAQSASIDVIQILGQQDPNMSIGTLLELVNAKQGESTEQKYQILLAELKSNKSNFNDILPIILSDKEFTRPLSFPDEVDRFKFITTCAQSNKKSNEQVELWAKQQLKSIFDEEKYYQCSRFESRNRHAFFITAGLCYLIDNRENMNCMRKEVKFVKKFHAYCNAINHPAKDLFALLSTGFKITNSKILKSIELCNDPIARAECMLIREYLSKYFSAERSIKFIITLIDNNCLAILHKIFVLLDPNHQNNIITLLYNRSVACCASDPAKANRYCQESEYLKSLKK